MKRAITIVGLSLLAGGLVFGGGFFFTYLRGSGPAVLPPGDDITEFFDEEGEQKGEEDMTGENRTEFPLRVQEGFSISLFTKDLPGARVMVQDGFGNFWVSQPSEGTVSLLEVQDGTVTHHEPIFRDLNRPHGLAVDPEDGLVLYIAETDRISRVRLYTEGRLEKIADLPGGGRHFTRTIALGPDNRLYVSIGSSCDTCVEEDPRRAAIYSMEKDGSDFRKFADGLRNAVFFTWHPVDGQMWATEMGRDFLGDDLPPDEINIVKEGGWYGWPWFYGNNIEDQKFINDTGAIPGYAKEPMPSHIDLQAHVSPLGLAFIPESTVWPEEYWYDLIVAYHGSWNRSEPVGYKLKRFRLDAEGNLQGREDFVTGWLQGRTALGRPVDVLVQPQGVMYITDDKAGVVYRVVYRGDDG